MLCTGGMRKWLLSCSQLLTSAKTIYSDLSKLRKANENFLASKPEETRDRHLVEIYVLAEANWLKTQPTVKKAIEERGLQIHSFVFDKEKEKTVRLVEEDEQKVEAEATEVDFTNLGRRSVEANDRDRVTKDGDKKCTGSCGGLGLCKKREENEKQYAF